MKQVHCSQCGNPVLVPGDFDENNIYCSRCFRLLQSVDGDIGLLRQLYKEKLERGELKQV